ncbi:MAG: sulfurtransferase [Lysobacter sp.]|nr:sulfurtransferase [Lysobacter sp.]
MSNPITIKNIAAYHFVPVMDPDALAAGLQARAETGGLSGTILVAQEGINLFLAGETAAIDDLVAALRDDPRFAEMTVKASVSSHVPFSRLKVKVKPEIISFRQSDASPDAGRAPTVSPASLARWIGQGADDNGRRLVLLDTRNREEVEYGTFADSMVLPIDNFTELPDAVLARREALADATVVSFCTGGIRCEKAALWMRAQGMENVLQLDGGILGYFEAVGGQGYEGACFVFDDRIALDPSLTPIPGTNRSESAHSPRGHRDHG